MNDSALAVNSAGPAIDVPAAATAQLAFPRSRFVEPLVFLGGVSSIGIELTASRLIAPYFGSSTFIWANLIGLTLTYLAIGYWIGGRVADRRPDPRLLYLCTAVAAVAAGLIPLFARPILEISVTAFNNVEVGAFYGSLLGTILLLAAPITLLGFVTPFAIRLRIADISAAGKTAGRIYALSTVGSIAGSFVPVLLLIPLFGTRMTFFILSGALLMISLAGLLESKARYGFALAALLGVVLIAGTAQAAGQIKPPYRGVLIHEQESEYNYIQVLREGDRVLLALNEGHAIHSIYDPDELLTGGPWDYFMVAPLFNEGFDRDEIDSALLIGLAGGTAARQMLAAYPQISIDGVEIDPAVAEVGRDYFAMDDARINVIVADGRYALLKSDRRYDIIGVDAYRQPYIPFQLTTKEFFSEVAERLTECGVAVVNVGRTETDYRLVEVVASTMRAVFPAVYTIDVERYTNTMVIGTTCASSVGAFGENFAALEPGDPVLRPTAERSLVSGKMTVVEPGGRVFTDDHAPVELVVDQIIVDAARDEAT